MTPPDVHSSVGIDRTVAAGMAQQEKRIGRHSSASLRAGFSFAIRKGGRKTALRPVSRWDAICIAPAAAGKGTDRTLLFQGGTPIDP